jgi:hypothetical protein
VVFYGTFVTDKPLNRIKIYGKQVWKIITVGQL